VVHVWSALAGTPRAELGNDAHEVPVLAGRELCSSARAVNDTGTEVCIAPVIKK